MTLTKIDMVERVSSETAMPKQTSVEVVETLLQIIKSSLTQGEDVLASGFGKFCVRSKQARKGRNPSTGEDLVLSARRVVTFKCSGKLKEKLNRK